MEEPLPGAAWWQVLTDELNMVKRRPIPALAVLGCGILLGLALGAVFVGTGGTSDQVNHARYARHLTHDTRRHVRENATQNAGRLPAASAGTNGASPPAIPGTAVLRDELSRGVREAEALHGEAAAGVWITGAPTPVLSGNTSTPHRMWSMSKAVVTIAALQIAHEQSETDALLAMRDAITRSDNCAIRRVIVGLQHALGGSVEKTVSAFEQVLARAHVTLARTPEAAPAEQGCVRYLEAHRGALHGSILGTTPEFGTAEWTVADAVAFTHALVSGVYGQAGEDLLGLMGDPKQAPLEGPALPHTPPLNWGAGAVFPASWKAAWKGGWGGSQNTPPHFLAGQIVALKAANEQIAAAALFVPVAEPENDNPGITQAPQALELMFARARIGLRGALGL